MHCLPDEHQRAGAPSPLVVISLCRAIPSLNYLCKPGLGEVVCQSSGRSHTAAFGGHSMPFMTYPYLLRPQKTIPHTKGFFKRERPKILTPRMGVLVMEQFPIFFPDSTAHSQPKHAWCRETPKQTNKSHQAPEGGGLQTSKSKCSSFPAQLPPVQRRQGVKHCAGHLIWTMILQQRHTPTIQGSYKLPRISFHSPPGLQACALLA